VLFYFFFFQAEDGIRDGHVTGVQTCALPISIIRAGKTYTLPRDMDKTSALAYWFSGEREVFVAEENGEIVGTYFLQANQQGGGEIGRASCRERVESGRGAVAWKEKK